MLIQDLRVVRTFFSLALKIFKKNIHPSSGHSATGKRYCWKTINMECQSSHINTSRYSLENKLPVKLHKSTMCSQFSQFYFNSLLLNLAAQPTLNGIFNCELPTYMVQWKIIKKPLSHKISIQMCDLWLIWETLLKISCWARLGLLDAFPGQMLTDRVYDRSGSDRTTPAPAATRYQQKCFL